MSAALKLPFDMTVEEFLDWCPDDSLRWQLVDGEPQAMAPARVGHGALQALVAARLLNHLIERDSPCTVVTAPGIIPLVLASKNFRIPDIGVTCSPFEAAEKNLRDPVLLVEILSPGNRRETWSNVWTYTTIPSVREILVMRTDEIRVELLRRGPDGTWPSEPVELTGGDLALESLGFRAPLASLYPKPLG